MTTDDENNNEPQKASQYLKRSGSDGLSSLIVSTRNPHVDNTNGVGVGVDDDTGGGQQVEGMRIDARRSLKESDGPTATANGVVNDNDERNDSNNGDDPQPLKFAQFPLPSITDLVVASKNRNRRGKNRGNGHQSRNNHYVDDDDDNFVGSRRRVSSSRRRRRSYYYDSDHEGNALIEDYYIQDEREECQLLKDSFTFWMTARYPFENICKDIRPNCCFNKNWKRMRQNINNEAVFDNEDNTNESPNTTSRYNNNNNNIAIHDQGILEEEMEDMNSPPAPLPHPNRRSSLQKANSKLRKVDGDYLLLPFWIAFFVNASQLVIYVIVISSVLLGSDLPPNADRWLRLAQIFALFVMLYTQSDFIDGIFLSTEKWKAFENITTPIKFNISAYLRIIIGNIGILSSFILVIYSTEVVEMLLNFAAMEFVATLDDAAFAIALKGFLGITLEKKALEISEFRYVRRTHRGSIKRVLVYVLYVLLVIGAFLAVVILQSKRQVGIHNEVYIQFDDTNIPDLFAISGVYKGCQGFRGSDTGDIAYFDISIECPPKPKDSDDGAYPGRSFVYCRRKELNSWVYLPKPTPDPCNKQNFLIKSIIEEENDVDSNAFDILTHAKASWIVMPQSTGGEAILKNVFVGSIRHFESSFLGCEGGLMAIQGLHEEPFDPLPTSSYPIFEEENEMYTNIFGLVYRPIFRRKLKFQRKGKYEVVVFDSLRWLHLLLNPMEFAIHINKTEECKHGDNDDEGNIGSPDCWVVFSKYFLTTSSWMFSAKVTQIQAISDPMIFLTPSDTGVPTAALQWYSPLLSETAVLPGKEFGDDYSYSYYGGDGFQCADVERTDCKIDDGESVMKIVFTTDIYPFETEILIYYGQKIQDIATLTKQDTIEADRNSEFSIPENVLVKLTSSSSENRHFLDACVLNDACIQVVFLDTFGDGLLYPGEYDISVGNQSESSFSATFQCRSYQFGPGCLESAPFNGTADNCGAEDAYDLIPDGFAGVDDANFFDDDFYYNNTFEPSDFETFNPSFVGSTWVPSHGNSTEAPAFPESIDCAENEILIAVSIHTDECSSSETFILMFFGDSIQDLQSLPYERVDGNSDVFSISPNGLTEVSFPDSPSYYYLQSCVPAEQCVQIVAVDTFGDGLAGLSPHDGEYTFQYGQEVAYGEEGFWECLLYQFGSDCSEAGRPNPNQCSYQDDILAFSPGG